MNENLLENFSRKFGTLGYDYGWDVTDSPYDDGIVIAKLQQAEINGQKDLWAIKTRIDGSILWEKPIGGSRDDEGAVIPTSDGGYLFVGHTWSYGNEQQILAVKTDIF